MQRVQRYFMFYVVAALVSGCAALGLPTAETFTERLAVGYGAVTEVRQLATTLLTAKKISSEDGQNVLAGTDNARAALDIARSISKTNLQAADSKLQAARTALTALQAYLAARQQGGN